MKIRKALFALFAVDAPMLAHSEAYCTFDIFNPKAATYTKYVSNFIPSFTDWRKEMGPTQRSFAKHVMNKYPPKDGDTPVDQVSIACPDTALPTTWVDREQTKLVIPYMTLVMVEDWKPR